MVRELASHRYGPGSNLVIGVMWVEFVVGSPSCSERFFSGYSVFPVSSITNTFKFKFDLERSDMFVCKQITICNKFQTYFYTCGSDWVRRKLHMAILYCGKHYQQCSARICLRIRLLLWEKGEFSNGKAPWYQCTHARTSCAPAKKKVDPFINKVIMRGQFPHTHTHTGAHTSFDNSHTTIGQSNTSYLVYMFADFLMVLISDHSLKLH